MRMLIVGGGRLGQELMKSNPRSVVIEAKPRRLEILREMFGDDRVIEGPWEEAHFDDGRIETVVIATHDDDRNIEIAVAAKERGIPGIVVKVKDPARIPEIKELGIEDAICPHQFAAKAIRASLVPRSKDLIEIPIFPDSPHIGKSIEELGFGLDAIIVGVVRNGSILRAEGLVIEKADHLLVVSIGGRSKELQKTVVRKESRLKPFERITTLIIEEYDLNVTLSESLYLARIIGAEVDMVFADPSLVPRAEDMATISGVTYAVRVVGSLDIDELPAAAIVEGRDPGCIALSASPRYRERRVFRRWRLYRMLKEIQGPILICKRRHPYYNILNIIDDHPDSPPVTELAFKLGFQLRSKLRVLRYCYLDPRGQERLVDNLVRLYGVSCRTDAVEGNPTIEFISEITSGDLDLTVVNWESPSITHDILGRTIMEGPSSVLIMRSPRNVLMP